ncbi:V4R domain-containing protein [Methanocaldococcus sp.]
MNTATRVIRMLEIIDNKAKFIGIKLSMIRNLLERYKDNEELLKEILKQTEGKKIHDLILEACPELKELEEKIKLEELEKLESEHGEVETKVEEEIRSRTSILAYFKDYLKNIYFGNNAKNIYYEIGKSYALKYNIKSIEELKEVLEEEFGECIIEEENNNYKVIIKDCREAKNYMSSEPVCHIASGVIAGSLENINDKKFIIDVTEDKCIAKGDDYCLFTAKKSRKLLKEFLK